MAPPHGQPSPLTVAWAYPEGALSSSWFRAYKRLKRTISRNGLDVGVELAPISALPGRLDVLVVPPVLQVAAQTVPGTHATVVAGVEDVQQKLDQILARLVDASGAEHGRSTATRPVIHVGFQLMTETPGR